MALVKYKKSVRIKGTERDKLGEALAERYSRGKSIRELAEGCGRSYGFVHRLLRESGVTLRGRGGPTRKAQGAPKRSA